MILDTLQNSQKYTNLHPGLEAGFQFLCQPNLKTVADGKYKIREDQIFAIVDRPSGRPVDEGRLEAHRKYIDIQYIVSGEESIGWKTIQGLTEIDRYDPEKDLIFFKEPPEVIIKVPAGSFALFFPEDTHLPLIGNGPIHKVIIKVAV